MILFRAKTLNGEWVEGHYLAFETAPYHEPKKELGHFILLTDSDEMDWVERVCEIDPKTLAQSTGLKDKNDKIIFGSVEYEEGKMSNGGDVLLLDISGNGLKYNKKQALMIKAVFCNAAWGYIHVYPDLICKEDRVWRSFWNEEDQEVEDSAYFEILGPACDMEGK